jgi:hypothetical protein
MDKSYTLKSHMDKDKGMSSSGLTKKFFHKEINILAKERPRKKILEMFALVLQQEHNKLAAKTPKKVKKSKISLGKSSNSSKEDMSIPHDSQQNGRGQ